MGFGVMIGISVIATFISLMTAIYWVSIVVNVYHMCSCIKAINFPSSFKGEMAKCEPPPHEIRGFECGSRDTYRALCTFAVFLFILQLFFIVMVFYYKVIKVIYVSLYAEKSHLSLLLFL